MDEYIIPLGGFEYAVQANSEEEARQKAMLDHVRSVGRQSVSDVEAKAVERSNAPVETTNMQRAIDAMSGTTHRTGIPADLAQEKSGTMLAAGLAGLTLPQAVMNPLGTAVSFPAAAAGSEAGKWTGRNLPLIGGDMASTALGTLGGLAAGGVGFAAPGKILGAAGGAKGVLQALMNPKGALQNALGSTARGAEGAAVSGVESAAEVAAAKAAKIAASEARAAEVHAARMETAKLRNDLLKQRLEGKVPARVAKPSPPAAPPTEGATALQPEPDFIDPSAVKVLPFPPAKGTVKPATNLGGAAKPGPAPTPPDKLEETLQATLDSLKAKKAGAVRGKSPVVDQALDTAEGMHQREATAGMTEAVADKRRRLGSQVVAREMGMERGQVQSDAGTILNEALGEVSPVIPADRWKDIVTKMKSLPPEERTAYVARARGVKNMAQIENLRRTLETLGLLLPVGVAAGSVDQ